MTAARADPVLHARSRRAQSGARDRQCLPQGGAQGGEFAQRRTSAPIEEEAGQGADSSGGRLSSEFLGPQKFRDLQADKKNEVGATVGLAWTEVGGSILTTEAAVMEGKGKLHNHRQAGRRDAGIGAGGHELCALASAPAGSAARFLPQPRHSRARARRRDSEGWAFGRHHHRHQHLQRADQHSGALRSRHDRRDHGARPGAAHRRLEGESCWRRIARASAK